MMITENLLLKCSSLFIILALFLQTCRAINPHYCSPSSCGNIHNISFPFRLKNDPKHCGNPKYELECENNVTTVLVLLDLNSHKYKVKEINYINGTISLVDVSMNNNTCSFPTVSLYRLLLRGRNYPYDTWSLVNSSTEGYKQIARPISFMSCPYPLTNSSLLTQLPTHCNYSKSTHTYIKLGPMKASDVRENCSADLIVLTSWNFTNQENVSFSEIHDSLVYGFDLSWFLFTCIDCNGRSKCDLNKGEKITCNSHGLGAILQTLRSEEEKLAQRNEEKTENEQKS